MNDHSAHTYNDISSEGGGSSGKPGGQQPKEHPREYFLPGKIVVHLDHPADKDPRELAGLLNEYLGFVPNPEGGPVLTTYLRSHDPGRRLNLANDVQPVQPQRILTFPFLNDQVRTFSIVPVELRRTDAQKVIDILLQINEVHKLEPVELKEGSDVFWRSESPNWLLGSAGHGKPHPPSPGSWPEPPGEEADNGHFKFIGNDQYPTSPLPFAEEKGANVHVAILDTAPCASDLDEAYETWHEENGLIYRLLKPEPDRKLRLVTDIYAEIELLDCGLARHRYWMADHGLFIAGEIASIAPESTIHLIKVFTSHGSASTLTLAQGLIKVLTDDEIKRPLVVNCSFGLAAPDPKDPDFSVYFQDFPEALQDSTLLEHMQTSLRELFEELTKQDQVIVVAAAGDDTDPEKGRAPARLPAAYESVIGVGALPKGFPLENKKYKAASYSNLADNPPETGYMTLGGEPRPGRGIVGLFASEIPDFTGAGGKPPKDPKEATRDHLKYKHNQEGNVEWAGASFAAPIITGWVANWCSQPDESRAPGDPAHQPINRENVKWALSKRIQTKTTARNEQVILVTQG